MVPEPFGCRGAQEPRGWRHGECRRPTPQAYEDAGARHRGAGFRRACAGAGTGTRPESPTASRRRGATLRSGTSHSDSRRPTSRPACRCRSSRGMTMAASRGVGSCIPTRSPSQSNPSVSARSMVPASSRQPAHAPTTRCPPALETSLVCPACLDDNFRQATLCSARPKSLPRQTRREYRGRWHLDRAEQDERGLDVMSRDVVA